MECVRNPRIQCPGHGSDECCLNNDTRFINCETCGTEGHIYCAVGNNPDWTDLGVCPDCNGERTVEIETMPITMEDLWTHDNCGDK